MTNSECPSLNPMPGVICVDNINLAAKSIIGISTATKINGSCMCKIYCHGFSKPFIHYLKEPEYLDLLEIWSRERQLS